jgi:hypothetical protein
MGHTHHCEVCKQPVAICGESYCEQDDQRHYCSVHHPDPSFHIEDKPIVRMTVKVEPDTVTAGGKKVKAS